MSSDYFQSQFHVNFMALNTQGCYRGPYQVSVGKNNNRVETEVFLLRTLNGTTIIIYYYRELFLNVYIF